MPSITLEGAKFEVNDLKLERSKDYPRQVRIMLRVRYDKAIIKINDEKIEMNSELGLGVYILRSEGYLEFKPILGDKSVKIRCSIESVWNSNVKDLDIISEPLSLEELYEIEECLSQQDVNLYWSVDCWGFLNKPENYELQPGTLVRIFVGCDRHIIISRLDFVRKILEPADLLKRRFIEVIVEPINTDELDRIPDGDVREALRLLLSKQRLLQNALDRLVRANRSSDYVSVIETVRDVVEGLTPKSKSPSSVSLFEALKKAFKDLGVIVGVDSNALNTAINELLETIGTISKGIFDYSSVFEHTTTVEGKLHYIPKPYKHDAEFAVLQAMTFLNYLIKVLKVYAQRL